MLRFFASLPFSLTARKFLRQPSIQNTQPSVKGIIRRFVDDFRTSLANSEEPVSDAFSLLASLQFGVLAQKKSVQNPTRNGF
jgi:hypothetical protein